MTLRIITFALAISQSLTPYLPNILGFGRRIEEGASQIFPIVPIGPTFAIWGPIFLGCIIFAGYALTPQGRKIIPQYIIKVLSIVFALITSWSIIVGYTDQYWLPVVVFVVAALLLLTLVSAFNQLKEFQIGWRYRLMLVPLYLFVGWCNTAIWLNMGTALLDYNLITTPLALQILSISVLLGVSARQWFTISYFKVPLAVIGTYLRAIIGASIALTQPLNPLLLGITSIQALGLIFIVIRRR